VELENESVRAELHPPELAPSGAKADHVSGSASGERSSNLPLFKGQVPLNEFVRSIPVAGNH